MPDIPESPSYANRAGLRLCFLIPDLPHQQQKNTHNNKTVLSRQKYYRQKKLSVELYPTAVTEKRTGRKLSKLQLQNNGLFDIFSTAVIFGLVSKCSATLASVAAPAPGAREGFGGPNYLRQCQENCYTDSGMGCDKALWWGCSCDTPATHWELRKEPRQGC